METEFTAQLEELKARVEGLEHNAQENKLSMVVFSGDLDRALASFIIAPGTCGPWSGPWPMRKAAAWAG